MKSTSTRAIWRWVAGAGLVAGLAVVWRAGDVAAPELAVAVAPLPAQNGLAPPPRPAPHPLLAEAPVSRFAASGARTDRAGRASMPPRDAAPPPATTTGPIEPSTASLRTASLPPADAATDAAGPGEPAAPTRTVRVVGPAFQRPPTAAAPETAARGATPVPGPSRAESRSAGPASPSPAASSSTAPRPAAEASPPAEPVVASPPPPIAPVRVATPVAQPIPTPPAASPEPQIPAPARVDAPPVTTPTFLAEPSAAVAAAASPPTEPPSPAASPEPPAPTPAPAAEPAPVRIAAGPVRIIGGPGITPGPSAATPPERIAPPATPAAPPAPIVLRRFAPVVVEDAATLDAGRLKLRLPGVAAIGVDELCRDGNDRIWPCGRRALAAIRGFVRGRAVECPLPKTARSGGFDTVCTIGGTDLGLWAIENGWARAIAGDVRAEAAEERAKNAGRGIHAAIVDTATVPVEPAAAARTVPDVPPDRTTAPLANGTAEKPPRIAEAPAAPAASPPPVPAPPTASPPVVPPAPATEPQAPMRLLP
jgi:endonuclease YncB( thermonuclease family)